MTVGAGLTGLASRPTSEPNRLAFVLAGAKRVDRPAPGTSFSSLEARRRSRIALGRSTWAGLVGKGFEEKTVGASSSELSWRRRSEGLLACDWLRSVSGVPLEGGCREALLGEEVGEVIVVVVTVA